MPDPAALIAQLTARYRPGQLTQSRSYYFSVGNFRATLNCHPDRCEVVEGRSDGRADVVIKTTPKLFQKVFVDGGMPGPIDIARGRFKTNDVDALKQLSSLFAG